MHKIVILGATSAIAAAAGREMAARGAEFMLVGRSAEKLSAVADDLRVRGAKQVLTVSCDLSLPAEHKALFDKINRSLPDFDTVLLAYGCLVDQRAAQTDWQLAEQELRTNFLSAVSILTILTRHFERLKLGTVAVITSVAGDRGRQSNYVYGAAKGGLAIYLQGMRNRLQASSVNVLTVKPGFVDTPMTANMKKGPLFASAESVGSGICKAIDKRKNVVYLPWFWLFIMLVIRHIPEFIFKRLKL